MDNFYGFASRIDGQVEMLGVSEKEDMVAFYQDSVYLLDLKTGGKVKMDNENTSILYIK